MTAPQISLMDMLIATHVGLKRQGPGSEEMTLKALSFLDDLQSIERVADLGCGTGGQTMVLARSISGRIVGLDQIPEFIEVLDAQAKEHDMAPRVSGIVGSMEDLPFKDEELDLIWSEGSIDAIGLQAGLEHWRAFLKDGGAIAFTCPSWLTTERPEAVARYWEDAGSPLERVDHNITVLLETGFDFIAAFALPQQCWTDHYFTPRERAEAAFAARHPDDEIVEEYLEDSRLERALFDRYGHHYGYVFYIGRKA
jgi:SAM-dependent methyltransferase